MIEKRSLFDRIQNPAAAEKDSEAPDFYDQLQAAERQDPDPAMISKELGAVLIDKNAASSIDEPLDMDAEGSADLTINPEQEILDNK